VQAAFFARMRKARHAKHVAAQEVQAALHLQSTRVSARETALSEHAASLNRRAADLDTRDLSIQQREEQFTKSMAQLQEMMIHMSAYENRLHEFANQPDVVQLLADKQGLQTEVQRLNMELQHAREMREIPPISVPESGQKITASPEFILSATASPISAKDYGDVSEALEHGRLPESPVVEHPTVMLSPVLTSASINHVSLSPGRGIILAPAPAPVAETGGVAAALSSASINHVSLSPGHGVIFLPEAIEKEKMSLQLLAISLAQVARMQKHLQEGYERREESKSDVLSTSLAQLDNTLHSFASGNLNTTRAVEQLQPLLDSDALRAANVVTFAKTPSTGRNRQPTAFPSFKKTSATLSFSPSVMNGTTVESPKAVEPPVEPPIEAKPTKIPEKVVEETVDVSMVAALSAKLRSAQIDLKLTEDALKTEVRTAALFKTEADSLRSALSQVTSQAQLFARVLDALRETGVLAAGDVPSLDAMMRDSMALSTVKSVSEINKGAVNTSEGYSARSSPDSRNSTPRTAPVQATRKPSAPSLRSPPGRSNTPVSAVSSPAPYGRNAPQPPAVPVMAISARDLLGNGSTVPPARPPQRMFSPTIDVDAAR
jgi:hypothetical protein